VNESYNIDKTELNISSRNLKEFPKEFLPLPDSLQRLFCSDNNLVSLPTLPDSLQILYCSDNKLVSLPTLPDSLQILDCYNNNLVSLPTLPDSLQILSCQYNNLVSLPTLPDSLQILYCDKLFKEIPVRLFNKGLGKDFKDNEVKEYLEKRLDIHPEEFVDVTEKYKHLTPTHLDNGYGFFDVNEDYIEKTLLPKKKREPLFKELDYDILYHDDKLTVTVPTTFKSTKQTTKGTNWCTSDEDCYLRHVHEGYIFFRFLFSNGEKCRLSWNWKYNNDFTWGGSDRKYAKIQSRLGNLGDTPFDIDGVEKMFLYNRNKLNRLTGKNIDMSGYRAMIKLFAIVRRIPEEAKKKVIEYRKNYEKPVEKEEISNKFEYDFDDETHRF
jgi:Leucine-rich repeat (LRR) protein